MVIKTENTIRLALPKGRMEKGVYKLFADAGINIQTTARAYRPSINLEEYEAKLLKPRDVVEMLKFGSRDIGFAGADWVAEQEADLVELLDTELDPVKLVAAAPSSFLVDGKLPKKPLLIASEYENLTKKWIKENSLVATFVRSYGATEVFPPEDADCIVDNTATGSTLSNNNLVIISELMKSSTRLYANPEVMDNVVKREIVENLMLVLKSVLEARKRVSLEVNVSKEYFETLVKILPCMKEPTISALYGETGFALKVAVPREMLPRLIPLIKANGGTDIVVTELSQIVP